MEATAQLTAPSHRMASRAHLTVFAECFVSVLRLSLRSVCSLCTEFRVDNTGPPKNAAEVLAPYTLYVPYAMRCQLLRNFLAENSESLLEFPTISRWVQIVFTSCISNGQSRLVFCHDYHHCQCPSHTDDIEFVTIHTMRFCAGIRSV